MIWLLFVSISACSSSGSLYLGEWTDIHHPDQHLLITRQDGKYSLQNQGKNYEAFYRGGNLFIDSPVGQATAYIDEDGHLTVNFLGEPWGEYRRLR